MKKTRFTAWLVCIVLVALTLSPALSATSYPYDTVSIDSVKLRKTASTSAVVLANISAGDSITVLGTSGKFYKVTYAGMTGYAMKSYVDGLASAESTAPASTAAPAEAIDSYPYDTTTADRVKLRKTASETANVLMVIPKDEIVTVYDVTSNGFAKVKYSGKTGYLMTAYVNLANIPTPTPVPTSALSANAEKYTALKSGASGSMVRALQEALTELGFYTDPVDTKYGAQTRTAVMAFQKKNKLDQTGVADKELQALLYDGKPRNSKGVKQAVKTVAPIAGATIQSGDTGEAVENLQSRLATLRYYTDAVNGKCDKNTVAAIKAFQSKNDLKANGVADSATLNVLYGSGAYSATDIAIVAPTATPYVEPPKDTLRKGDSGIDVQKVQQKLKDLGYYSGAIDGKFGDTTLNALKKFQTKMSLTPDGVCGSLTIAALFASNPTYSQATATPAPEATMAPVTLDNVVVVQSGSRGVAVLNLQKRLAELGYYSSRLDGVYLADDITAVRAFQQANGLTVDGKAGYNTQVLLYSDAAVRGDQTATSTTTLRYGDTGANVTAMQNRLIELGYLVGSADGLFSTATKTALVAFQKANGLTRDGVAGAKTQTALYAATAIKNTTVTSSSSLTMGAVSTAVKDMQTRLIALGYLSGTADGIFGTKTSLALIAFQNRNGLAADGIAGSKTLAMLNSSSAKEASASSSTTTSTAAPTLTSAPNPADVRYANWYSEIKARCRLYPNATIYDFTTGISWQVNMFSLGAHADAEPLTAQDTANMNKAFGGVTTWTPKAVWVVLGDGRIYMASTHNTPHSPNHIKDNNFNGHLCIHFPRTEEQVAAIGPYATQHQKAIDLGWAATLKRRGL